MSTSIPVAFPDAQLAIRDLLRDLLPGVTVSTRDIAGNDRDGWPRPYVKVDLDGTYRNARLNGRATVRLLCYAADVGESLALAARVEALLLSDGATSDRVRGCNALSGPLESTDIDNGLPFAYFTVTARLRPQAL